MRAKPEVRVVTTVAAVLCALALVTPYFPEVEAFLNTVALWMAAVFLVVMVVVLLTDVF